MKEVLRKFQFFNNETESIIFHYSILLDLPDHKINEILEKKREEVARLYKIYVFNIYWLEIKDSE